MCQGEKKNSLQFSREGTRQEKFTEGTWEIRDTPCPRLIIHETVEVIKKMKTGVEVEEKTVSQVLKSSGTEVG